MKNEKKKGIKMKTQPKTFQEALDLVYNLLNQGDSRYNDPENERALAKFILSHAISLEEKEISQVKKPEQNDLIKIGSVQKEEKYLAKILLKQQGFKDNEIFFEARFYGSQADVLAESNERVIPVECCSCRIDKIIDYLLKTEEVWVTTRGLPPWEKIPYLKEKMKLFIFKKGPNWNNVLDFKKKNLKSLQTIGSPIDCPL